MKADEYDKNIAGVEDFVLEASDGEEGSIQGVKERTLREQEVLGMDKQDLFRLASEIDEHKMDEPLAAALIEIGLAHVVVARLGRGDKFSQDFADRLIESGYGMAVLANEEHFPGLSLDETLVDRLLKTQAIDADCAKQLQGSSDNRQEFLWCVKQERLRQLEEFIATRGGGKEIAIDLTGSRLAVDDDLFGVYAEKVGKSQAEQALFILDRSRSNWERSPEWKAVVRKYFTQSPDKLFEDGQIRMMEFMIRHFNMSDPNDRSFAITHN